jgi:hypothetical protein
LPTPSRASSALHLVEQIRQLDEGQGIGHHHHTLVVGALGHLLELFRGDLAVGLAAGSGGLEQGADLDAAGPIMQHPVDGIGSVGGQGEGGIAAVDQGFSAHGGASFVRLGPLLAHRGRDDYHSSHA